MFPDHSMLDMAAPLAWAAPNAPWFKWPLIAMALLLVAAQPTYALMVWRTMRRSWRQRRRPDGRLRLVWPITTIEAAIILIFVGGAAALGIRPVLPVAVAAALAMALLTLALLDFRYFWLPDRLTLPLGGVGLAAALPDFDLARDAALAGAAAGLAFYALHLAYRHLRGIDGLGLGDVKLVAALGMWVGLAAVPWLVLMAALTALGAAAVTALLSPSTRGGADALAPQARSPFGLHLALAGWIFICLRQSPLMIM